MNIKCLITARAGSSFPDKSFAKISNNPCIYYSVNSLMQYGENNLYCSSDCSKILNYCEEYGFNPIQRPAHLSSDTAQHHDVLIHAITQIEQQTETKIDILVVALPNNPFIFDKHVKSCVDILKGNKHCDSVIPIIFDNDKHPFRAKSVNNQNYLTPWFKESSVNTKSTNRQALPKNSFICHNFWVLRRDVIIQSSKDFSIGQHPWRFMGDKIYGYQYPFSHDIHSELDVKIINSIFNEVNK